MDELSLAVEIHLSLLQASLSLLGRWLQRRRAYQSVSHAYRTRATRISRMHGDLTIRVSRENRRIARIKLPERRIEQVSKPAFTGTPCHP